MTLADGNDLQYYWGYYMWYYNTSGHIIFLQHTTDCEDDWRYFLVKFEVLHYCIFPSALKGTNHISHSKSTQGKKGQEFTLTSTDFDEDMNPSGRISIYCHYHIYIHTHQVSRALWHSFTELVYVDISYVPILKNLQIQSSSVIKSSKGPNKLSH